MRDALVDRELHALGVNQDHAHLLGRGTHHDRGDHGVDKGRLTRTRLAGHEHVRGLGQVGDHVAALDVLADADDERVLVAAGGRGTQDVAEGHVFAVGVGDLDADGALAGDRREDTHVCGSHRVGDILRQVGELVDLDARAEDNLVAGDRRAARKPGDACVDVEVGEDLAQGRDDLVVDGRARHVRGPGDKQVLRRQRVADRVVEVGLEGTFGLVGDRRGRRFFLGLGHVRGYLLGLRGHGGTHLGEHLGGRVGRRGTRPGRGGRVGRGHRHGAGLQQARLADGLRVGGLAEGLVPVVFVEEGVVAGGQILAAFAARLLGGVRVRLRLRGVAVRSLPAQARGEVTQARRNVGDGGAGGQQDGVGQEQDEQGTRTPPGQEEGEGAGDEPAEQAACRVEPGIVPHPGVTARNVDEAGQGHRDADAACHVVGQGGAPRASRDEFAGQGDEEEGQDDGEDTDESRGGSVDGVPGLAGNLEPLAQGDNDRCGDSDEGRGVALDLRIRGFPGARGADARARDGREETSQEAGLGGLGSTRRA